MTAVQTGALAPGPDHQQQQQQLVATELQTASVRYFERKIKKSQVFCLSGWLAVPIIPDKWSSAYFVFV
jgi:hypothetical protein